MKNFEKELIINELKRIEDFVNAIHARTEEKTTELEKLIETLKSEAKSFKTLQDYNEKRAKETENKLFESYYKGKAFAYNITVKVILEIIEDYE